MIPAIAKRFPYGLFATLLLLDTSGFLMDKVTSRHASGDGLAFYWSILTRPWLWITLGIGLLQLATWTKILSKVDLSLAFPISSLCLPTTMIAASLIFRETLPISVWVGGLIITVGVAVLGNGEAKPRA